MCESSMVSGSHLTMCVKHCWGLLHWLIAYLQQMLTLFAVRTSIVEPVGNVSSVEGGRVTLPCVVHSDPHYALSHRWLHNSSLINVQSSATHSVTDANGSLVLQSVSTADAGLYTCMVDSDGGRDNSSGWLHVIG